MGARKTTCPLWRAHPLSPMQAFSNSDSISPTAVFFLATVSSGLLPLEMSIWGVVSITLFYSHETNPTATLSLPQTLIAPEPIPFVGSLPFAKLFRHLAPGVVRTHDPEDAAEYSAMVMARSPRRWLLRRQQWPYTFPFEIGQLRFVRCERDRCATDARSITSARTSRGVAPRGDLLVCPSPARPAEPEPALRVGFAHREHQAAHLRHRERDQAGIGPPFFALSSCRATKRRTTRYACASRQSVANRCHASHLRTS